jgi:hypothetical protein
MTKRSILDFVNIFENKKVNPTEGFEIGVPGAQNILPFPGNNTKVNSYQVMAKLMGKENDNLVEKDIETLARIKQIFEVGKGAKINHSDIYKTICVEDSAPEVVSLITNYYDKDDNFGTIYMTVKGGRTFGIITRGSKIEKFTKEIRQL